LSLTGEMTFDSVPLLYQQAKNLLSGKAPVSIIDLSRVTAVDSAGLALLLEWQAAYPPEPEGLNIRNAPAGLMSLARLCEADEVIKMSGREDAS